MGKLEETLTAGEQVVKQRGGVTINSGGRGTGDLYLTNHRVLFLHKKRWALLAPFYASAAMGQDLTIPLQSITNIKKGFLQDLQIQADKSYSFTGVDANAWIDTLQRMMRPAATPTWTPTPRPPAAPTTRFCTNCGSPFTAQVKFCGHCGHART